MLPYLEPLLKSIWVRTSAFIFAISLFSSAIWVIVREYLMFGPLLSATVVSLWALLFAAVVGQWIAEYAMKSTDFLARAIVYVQGNSQNISPPDPESLRISKDFLQRTAQQVYDLASKGEQLDSASLKESTYFMLLAEHFPLPLIVLTHQQTIGYINPAGLKYIEKSREDINEKPIYDAINLSFTGEDTLEAWLNQCKDNTLSKSETWQRVRIHFDENRHKQFDLVAHYSHDEPHGIETILVLADKTDVYERDDRDLTYIALAVHELRTPLTVMRGYIEVFENEISQHLDPEQTTFMHNMSASAQQLSSFVSNILDVARVDENALTLRLKEENWQEVLKDACKDMELRAKVRSKSFKFDIADNIPTVAVDKVSIYEVINNLLDNAIKYTHTDEEIVISTYEKDGMVETTVTDKGVGIDPSSIGHLFTKFYRAPGSKSSTGGTGLGLYLCKSIVKAHGGNIWVQSKPGQGSTFGFTIPIYSSVADQLQKEEGKGIVRGAHGWIKNHSIYRG